MSDKAGEQPTIKQADILATEFDRIRLAFDSVNRDRDRLKAIITCLRVNAIKGQDPEALLAFMRDGLEGIDAGLTIGEMVTAYSPTDNTRTTSLAAQDGLVEALEKVRKCALVVPSIFPDRPPSVSWIVSELTKILPEMDAALTAIKEQHHD